MAAGLTLTQGLTASVLSGEVKVKRPVHIFTKCLQFLDYQKMAEVVASNGFDGADLTVRPGGQVLPENVETDLPKVMKALKNAGIGTNMVVTRISDPDDKFTRPVLKALADAGIRYYRLGTLNYDPKKSMPENLELHRITFNKFEKLNREFGLTGNYQNHSGQRVGGPVWDLYYLVKECDPRYMGVQYDIRHATVEGGMAWPLGLKLLAPWIGTIDIKDFVWYKDEEGKWRVKNMPLGTGMVDFDSYLTMLSDLDIVTPVSIHYEYDLGGAEKGKTEITMSLEEIDSWIKKDINFLQNQFTKNQL